LGAVTRAPDYCLVTEYVVNGSLWDLLHSQALAIDPALMVRLARDTACGLYYLHSHTPPLLHRDLKSANLLVDGALNVKLSDFGMSRLKSYSHTMTGNCGTFQWMAPEVLASRRYTESADVYSYGIVCWELAMANVGSPAVPYDGMNQIQAAVQVLQRNLRPPVPRKCPVLPFADLMRRCWAADPAKRPSFEQVLQKLEKCSDAANVLRKF